MPETVSQPLSSRASYFFEGQIGTRDLIIAYVQVGSIFEIINKNSIFGVLPPSSPFWLPILGTFGVTGLPSAGLLLFLEAESINTRQMQALALPPDNSLESVLGFYTCGEQYEVHGNFSCARSCCQPIQFGFLKWPNFALPEGSKATLKTG